LPAGAAFVTALVGGIVLLLLVAAGCGGEAHGEAGETMAYSAEATRTCLRDAREIAEFDPPGGEVLIPASEGRIRATLVGFASDYHFVLLFAGDETAADHLTRSANGVGAAQPSDEWQRRRNVVYWVDERAPLDVVASVTGCLR
jgi:hypothetical protein